MINQKANTNSTKCSHYINKREKTLHHRDVTSILTIINDEVSINKSRDHSLDGSHYYSFINMHSMT